MVVIGVAAAAMLLTSHEPSSTGIATVEARAENAPVDSAAKKATKSAADMTPANASVDSAANAALPKPAPVTMAGCLERHDEMFRLKDATGEDAPKARSWKSGFLKKGSAPIDIVDASSRLRLANHVGQRVSVTGVLVDREMQVRSLHRVAASCS
jgi:hypothetical protein